MGNDVNYLYEPEGSELHWDGLQKAKEPSAQQASLAGSAPRYSSAADRPGLGGTKASQGSSYAAPDRAKRVTPEEMLKEAEAMLEAQRASGAAQLESGPSVHDAAPSWLNDFMTKVDSKKVDSRYDPGY